MMNVLRNIETSKLGLFFGNHILILQERERERESTVC
jgi:hypothetical protein